MEYLAIYCAGAGTAWALSVLTSKCRMQGLKIRWYWWAALATWYLWTLCGISFVTINMTGGHAKATTVGAFVFFSVTAIGGLALARVFGILPKAGKSSPQAVT